MVSTMNMHLTPLFPVVSKLVTKMIDSGGMDMSPLTLSKDLVLCSKSV